MTWYRPAISVGSGTGALCSLNSGFLPTSARGPAQLAAAHQVQVDVVDAVTRVLAGIEDEAESALRQALRPREFGGTSHQAAHQLVVARRQVEHARDVPLGNDEDVNGPLRVDVVEGEHGVVLIGDARGDAARHDLAEQARHDCRVYTKSRPPPAAWAAGRGRLLAPSDLLV